MAKTSGEGLNGARGGGGGGIREKLGGYEDAVLPETLLGRSRRICRVSREEGGGSSPN